MAHLSGKVDLSISPATEQREQLEVVNLGLHPLEAEISRLVPEVFLAESAGGRRVETALDDFILELRGAHLPLEPVHREVFEQLGHEEPCAGGTTLSLLVETLDLLWNRPRQQALEEFTPPSCNDRRWS